jgi:signal recognition particle subunit SRP68
MKDTHTGENNAGKGFPASARSHIVSRLHKAAKQAKGLAELLSQKASGASETSWLEAMGYAYALAGAEEFEKHGLGARSSDKDVQREKWEPCLRNFSAARVIYSALVKSSKKDIYKDAIAGYVDQGLRIAAYQSHIPRTIPVSAVAQRLFPRDEARLVEVIEKLDDSALTGEEEESDIPNTITWRKRKANIVDASIGLALAAISSAQEHLTTFLDSSTTETTPQEKAAAYDEVLIASQDAVDATRHAIEEHKKEGVSPGDPRMQDLQVTNLAVNFDLVGWRVGRNRVLIGGDDGAELNSAPLKKPKRPRKDGEEWQAKEEGTGRKLARLRERVVLYDAILQSIDSVKELPGAAEPSFSEELDGTRAYFQALK